MITCPQSSTLLLQGGFIGIAWMCQLQTLVLIYLTFKRFSGLYFWSICVATISVIVYTIAVALYNVILPQRYVWVTTILTLVGYLAFIPAEFLVIYSRLQLLYLGPKMTRFVQFLLISEYLLIEIPVNTITLVAMNTPADVGLMAVIQVLVGVGAVVLAVVFMTMPGLYLWLAWKSFGPNASSEVRSIFGRLGFGTLFLLLLEGANIGTWFMKKISIRGCWLPLLFSCTLLVEFWILNHLSLLASTTLRNPQRLNLEDVERMGDDSGYQSPRNGSEVELPSDVEGSVEVLTVKVGELVK